VEPQDLVQDGWMRALKGLGRFQYNGPGSFRRWLKTEIARSAKDAARRGGAGRDAVATMADRGIEEPEGLRGTPSSQSPSRLADRVERSTRVWDALHDSRMPPLYREVFIARVIEERPREDVARDQGVNVDTGDSR
jgi:RNA polymerase sigma factor (sigma-70 family)